MTDPIQQAAQAIAEGRHVIALTGAGISVESGIPDFRSPGGIWDTYPPEEFATIDAFRADPEKVWGFWYDLGALLGDKQPNPAHRALTELQRMGRLAEIITQNIDNLHQTAGSTRVVEYHGNARHMRCVVCGATADIDLTTWRGAPRCGCGGVMKPDVVLFGEMIPMDALEAAERAAAGADVVLVIGTSASVYPAAAIPVAAKRRGSFIIECNLETTELTAHVTDAFIQGPAGTTVPRLVKALSRSLHAGM